MAKNRKMWIIIFAIFVLGSVFHYFYGTFDKSVELLPDELRYYCMARSIYLGDGLRFKGLPLSYTKFGYMLFLAPFFAVGDGILRVKLITLFSSIVMMTSIFPLYGIMNRLNLSDKLKTFILISFMVFPGLMMSATYMSEVLYWPLMFLFIYLWLLNRDKKNIIVSIALGIIGYYGYAVKEVFLGVIVSVVIFEILFPIVSYFTDKKDNRLSLKTYYDKKNIFATLSIVLMFVLIHVVLSVSFFAGMSNSYDNQIGLDVLLSFDNILYMLYGFIYYLVTIPLAVLIMPIIAPLLLNRQLDDKTRALHFFNMVNVITMIGIVIFTITVREDFGEMIPRIHFRYFDPLLVIFIVTFFVCLDRKDVALKFNRFNAVTIISVLIITFAFFRGVRVCTEIDQFSLNWIDSLMSVFGDTKGVFIADAIIAAVVIFTTLLLFQSRKQIVGIVAFVIMLFVSIFNTVTTKERIVSYMNRPADLIDAAVDINNKMKDIDGNILYISAYSNGEKCIDTYFDRNMGLMFVDWNYSKGLDAKTYEVNDMTFPMQFGLWQLKYDDVNTVDYILVEKGYEPVDVMFDNVTRDEELSNNHFDVYRNNIPTKMTFVKAD